MEGRWFLKYLGMQWKFKKFEPREVENVGGKSLRGHEEYRIYIHYTHTHKQTHIYKVYIVR
jgi:hypothetical protein